MFKEKIDSDIDLKISGDSNNQINSLSVPVIKSAIILSTCIIGASMITNGCKVISGIKNEVIEYKDYSDGKLIYPYYKIVDNDDANAFETKKSTEKKGYTIELYTSDAVSQKIIYDLRKEIAMMKSRLEHSLPMHTLTYMVVSSIMFAVACTLLFVRFVANVYTVDPYYLICVLIISAGLFLTAKMSLKDWKDTLINGKEGQ